ncbi:hypothetical protein AG1IA_10360 [Rhizoctonia solani AG-1 IA]|uniref:Uncharacterized protein n=1 Tax=Thanatephorus cucumeris (strain AG1-IA) TaxID=983506 RepID=L8WCC3_THACA|nr:hypothetical protein AG1IA_10360 [Rhizoctonia solani AG-1 IA]
MEKGTGRFRREKGTVHRPKKTVAEQRQEQERGMKVPGSFVVLVAVAAVGVASIQNWIARKRSGQMARGCILVAAGVDDIVGVDRNLGRMVRGKRPAFGRDRQHWMQRVTADLDDDDRRRD